jgi:hypothetical protein
MKSAIPIILCLVASLLIGYGFYAFQSIQGNNSLKVLIASVAFLYSILTLITTFALKYESNRIKTVIRFTGSTFFIIGIFLLILLMFFTESNVWVVLPMGLLSTLYLSVVYLISKSGQ